MPRALLRSAVALLLAVAAVGCDDELTADYANPTFDDGTEREVSEPVPFAERDEGTMYGLPRDGQASIADLLALMPVDGVPDGDPTLFVAPDDQPTTDQCEGGGATVLDGLPMVIEGVVTLHPRQYLKVPICGQDERNYGSWVIEDDTGGIVMLRDGRVAPYTFGDRVRVTVRGVLELNGGDPTTRAVVIADVEALDASGDVLYSLQETPFSADDVGRTRRVEGYVAVAATSENFNEMILASDPLPEVPPAELEVDTVCIENCGGACRSRCPSDNNAVCRDVVCRALCAEDSDFDRERLPEVCWIANVSIELGRRGFSPALGSHVTVTGPVVSSFGLKIWIQRIDQVEFLDR